MARKRKAKVAKEAAIAEDAVADGAAQPPKPKNEGDGNIEESNKVEHFDVSYGDKKPIPCERRGEGDSPALAFTHGAGGGLSAPATSEFADGFAAVSPIVSFQGSMNLPSRQKMFNTVLDHEGFYDALGGRSMGARAACLAAAHHVGETRALVLVSFPLVGGKKGDSRERILLDLDESVDVLFVSGDRDSMCDLEQLRDVMGRMKARSWLAIVKGADHGMSWSPKALVSIMRRRTGSIAAEWLKQRDNEKRYCALFPDTEGEELQWSGWLASYPDLAAAKTAEGVEDEGEPAAKAGASENIGDEPPPAKRRKRGKKG